MFYKKILNHNVIVCLWTTFAQNLNSMLSSLNLFRIIAFLEGVSYLLLMAASIYKRTPEGTDQYVKLLGMPHGLLFVAYIAFAIFLRSTYIDSIYIL